MAYELPEQVAGLNLSEAPAGPSTPGVPAAVPPQLADMGFGTVNLPGYTAEERTHALEPTPTWGDRLSQIGTVLEAFGSGYRGEEPLFLKLRRQQAVEEAQQLDRKLKVEQFQLEQQKRSDAVFQQGVQIAMDDGKPIETRIAALDGMSRQNPSIAALKPLITKQVLQDLPMAKDYLGDDVMQAIQGIQRNPNGKVDFPGGLTGIAAEIKNKAEYGRAVVKERGEETRETILQQRLAKNESLNPADKDFLVAREKARMKRDEEFDTLVLQKRKLTADVDVAEKTTTQRVAQAGQAAAPKMRQYPIDQEGNVRVEQYDEKVGKWVTLSDKVKASPTTSINIGGEPKAMPPEQAARFSHFLEAREAAKQLPGLIFDKSDNIKSNNLLTGMFPMGGLPFTEGRTLNQVVERGIQAKLRAETGAAAPENEVRNIALRYKPSVGDSKEQIKGKLEAFTNYIEDAIWVADPTGMHQGRAAGRKPLGNANVRGEALKKLHPDWTDYEVLSRLNAEGY